jgi:hypothetical protein
MQLRSHPLMRFAGTASWPPVWTSTSPEQSRIAGEVGVLKSCTCNDRVENLCFLFIEHEGQPYVGALVLDDPAFREQVFSVLKQNMNRPIAEIGGLDLPYIPR